jgi:hypothetical protein
MPSKFMKKVLAIYTLPEIRASAGFADAAEISPYAKDAVEKLYRAGVVNGKEENRFAPAMEATRAEVAAMLHRFMAFAS